MVEGEHFETSVTQSFGHHTCEGLVIINNENPHRRSSLDRTLMQLFCYVQRSRACAAGDGQEQELQNDRVMEPDSRAVLKNLEGSVGSGLRGAIDCLLSEGNREDGGGHHSVWFGVSCNLVQLGVHHKYAGHTYVSGFCCC
jgi:hypothetical protein